MFCTRVSFLSLVLSLTFLLVSLSLSLFFCLSVALGPSSEQPTPCGGNALSCRHGRYVSFIVHLFLLLDIFVISSPPSRRTRFSHPADASDVHHHQRARGGPPQNRLFL